VVRLVDALGVEIAPDLAEDVFIARFFKVGRDHFLCIGRGGIAREPHQLRRPEAEQLVAPRERLEAQFLVMDELIFETVSALVEGGHEEVSPFNGLCRPPNRRRLRYLVLGIAARPAQINRDQNLALRLRRII